MFTSGWWACCFLSELLRLFLYVFLKQTLLKTWVLNYLLAHYWYCEALHSVGWEEMLVFGFADGTERKSGIFKQKLSVVLTSLDSTAWRNSLQTPDLKPNLLFSLRTLSYKNRYVRVPDGHFWIEGDHHGHSLDSNSFGPVWSEPAAVTQHRPSQTIRLPTTSLKLKYKWQSTPSSHYSCITEQ